jgi:hypothetical protein
LRLRPDLVMALINLASIWATSADPAVRNPEKAVLSGERAARLSDYRRPEVLYILAKSYRAAGRLAEERATAELARELALAAGNIRLAEVIAAEMVREGESESVPPQSRPDESR